MGKITLAVGPDRDRRKAWVRARKANGAIVAHSVSEALIEASNGSHVVIDVGAFGDHEIDVAVFS